MSRQLVLLTSDTLWGRIAADYLAGRFDNLVVLTERPASTIDLIRRRLRRLGPVRVLGQLSFGLVQRLQARRSRQRIATILDQHGLHDSWPEGVEIFHIGSVNDAACVEALRNASPAVIAVVGTRLIDTHVLEAVSAPFINYHAGITPKYRGVHGGYWALYSGDKKNCGVTVHLIDEGIDTGGVLLQERVTFESADNFSTYPFVQLAHGLQLMERAVNDALAGKVAVKPSQLPSRLWTHPTLWQYLIGGVRQGVW